MRVCVCVCVWECVCDRVWVCVCVCVSLCDRECVCVCVSESVCVCVWVFSGQQAIVHQSRVHRCCLRIITPGRVSTDHRTQILITPPEPHTHTHTHTLHKAHNTCYSGHIKHTQTHTPESSVDVGVCCVLPRGVIHQQRSCLTHTHTHTHQHGPVSTLLTLTSVFKMNIIKQMNANYIIVLLSI